MPKPNQLRIVSDGTGPDTVIYVDDKVIEGVIHLEIEMEPASVNTVRLEMRPVSTDIHADLGEVRFYCPACSYMSVHNCSQLGTAE